jgi:hypothetical protein
VSRVAAWTTVELVDDQHSLGDWPMLTFVYPPVDIPAAMAEKPVAIGLVA